MFACVLLHQTLFITNSVCMAVQSGIVQKMPVLLEDYCHTLTTSSDCDTDKLMAENSATTQRRRVLLDKQSRLLQARERLISHA
jgi:Dynamin GTPase effector domain